MELDATAILGNKRSKRSVLQFLLIQETKQFREII